MDIFRAWEVINVRRRRREEDSAPVLPSWDSSLDVDPMDPIANPVYLVLDADLIMEYRHPPLP